jgi:hypothetical protein
MLSRAFSSIIRLLYRSALQALRLTIRLMIAITPWIIRGIWFELRLMALSLISLFVGVPTSIHRLAASETERQTGYPYDQKIDAYNWNRMKATMLIIGGWLSWIIFGIGLYFALTRMLN